jgi:DtxR family transcriptional regulator, manganese transport regulator
MPRAKIETKSFAKVLAKRASRQAAGFQRVRDAHQTEVAEDYVELIADLIEETGEARVVDLAGRLGVSNATVNNTIQRLQRDGLVHSKPYRSIFLTDEGEALATTSRERHVVVRDFLLALGVTADVAEVDAEGIEHHVSDATLAAFRRFLDKGRR